MGHCKKARVVVEKVLNKLLLFPKWVIFTSILVQKLVSFFLRIHAAAFSEIY